MTRRTVFVDGQEGTTGLRIHEVLGARPDIALTFLFLDCAGGELERRFNETRRRHPMADGRPVQEGIAAERELLEPLRRWAEVMIDTTAMTSNDLQTRIRELFDPASEEAFLELAVRYLDDALSAEELAAGPRQDTMFDRLDADGDGAFG